MASVTLNPTKSIYVATDRPANNYNGADYLRVGLFDSASTEDFTYLHFDVPAGEVTGARLRMLSYSGGVWNGAAPFAVAPVEKSWQAQSVSVFNGSAWVSATPYAAAKKAYREAQEEELARKRAAAAAEEEAISQEYDALRKNTYAHARLSAISNNEALAAKGLAGGLYDETKSGVSETSRVAQEIALGNRLNESSLAERQDKEALAVSLREAQSAANQNISEYEAKLLMEEQRAEQEYALAAFEAEYKRRQDALSQAWRELSVFGQLVTASSAEALGLPIGTTKSSFAKKGGGGGKNRTASASAAAVLTSSGKGDNALGESLQRIWDSRGAEEFSKIVSKRIEAGAYSASKVKAWLKKKGIST